MATVKARSIHELPLEILHKIFSQLDEDNLDLSRTDARRSEEKKTARLVCRRWKSLIREWFFKFRGVLTHRNWYSIFHPHVSHLHFDEIIVDDLVASLNELGQIFAHRILERVNSVRVKKLTFGTTNFCQASDHIAHHMTFSRNLKISIRNFVQVLIKCRPSVESLTLTLNKDSVTMLQNLNWPCYTLPMLSHVHISNQFQVDCSISYRRSYDYSSYFIYNNVPEYESVMGSLLKLHLPQLRTFSCLFFITSVDWEEWKPFLFSLFLLLGISTLMKEATLDFFLLTNFIIQVKILFPDPMSASVSVSVDTSDSDSLISHHYRKEGQLLQNLPFITVQYFHVTNENTFAVLDLEYDAIRSISEHLCYLMDFEQTSDMKPEDLHLDRLKALLTDIALKVEAYYRPLL